MQKEKATLKLDNGLVVIFDYKITNPLIEWADFDAAFGPDAKKKMARLADYHGTKCAARGAAAVIADRPEYTGLTATELKKVLDAANITVSHGQSQRGPSKVDLAKGKELLARANSEPDLIAQFVELAKQIGYTVPKAWTPEAIAALRQARRAWVKKQDILA